MEHPGQCICTLGIFLKLFSVLFESNGVDLRLHVACRILDFVGLLRFRGCS